MIAVVTQVKDVYIHFNGIICTEDYYTMLADTESEMVLSLDAWRTALVDKGTERFIQDILQELKLNEAHLTITDTEIATIFDYSCAVVELFFTDTFRRVATDYIHIRENEFKVYMEEQSNNVEEALAVVDSFRIGKSEENNKCAIEYILSFIYDCIMKNVDESERSYFCITELEEYNNIEL